jgi:hypothetical protein
MVPHCFGALIRGFEPRIRAVGDFGYNRLMQLLRVPGNRCSYVSHLHPLCVLICVDNVVHVNKVLSNTRGPRK